MSNSLDSKVSNFQNKEVDNITAIDVNQESVSRSNTNIQHQVIINLPQQPGPLHLGNVYHLNMSQGQAVDFLSKTQCNKFLQFWKINSFTKVFQIFIVDLTLPL